MSPSILWFPLILILYGEASYCKVTRRCSRSILYSYLLTLVITANTVNIQLGLIFSYFTIMISYIYCMGISERPAGRGLFATMIILMSYVLTAVIFRTFEYDILVEGWSLLEHSSYIYREGSLIALSCVSFLTMNNHRVGRRENIIGIIAMVSWVI